MQDLRRPDAPLAVTVLVSALVLALCSSLVASFAAPGEVVAATTTKVALCGVNLRTSPYLTARIRTTRSAGTRVTVVATVSGGSWRAVCGGRTVSGHSWYRISAINGRSVRSLYGVYYLYGATGLFRSVTTTATTAPSTSTADPSGQALPVGSITVGGQAWQQVFADNFAGESVPVGSFPTAASDQWNAYPDGWKDTTGHGTYEASKVVSIGSGLMNLDVHQASGMYMVAAPVAKIPGADSSTWGDLLYGRYAIRFRADAVYGYKTAWLLWPESGTWPKDGEIDFPEGDLDGHICAFMHWMNATSGTQQDAYCTSTTYTGWHTAVVEWLPSRVTFYLDGTVIGNSTSHIPSTPMHWVIQTETSTDGEVPGSAGGNVQVDWATVYRPC